MSEPLSAERRAAIKAAIEHAHTEIGEVASVGVLKRFRMSIPAQPDRDSDLIISEALKGAEELLAEVARLRQAVNAYSATLDRVATVPAAFQERLGVEVVEEFVRRSDLNQALGLTADGRGVS